MQRRGVDWTGGLARARGAAVALAVSLLGACVAHGREQVLLDRFFAASRLRDRTALEQVATVIFEPREQGIVTTFTIIGVSELAPAGRTPARQVTVSAPVRLPDGHVSTRRIVLVLERRGEWLVTGFTVSEPRGGP